MSELMLEGKSVLVAGIGPGLGRSIAMAATAAGADVALVARRQGPLDELAADLAPTGRQVVTVAADVTVPADCARVAQSVIDAFGGLDALVYNAYAPSLGTTLVDADLDEWRQVMEVNAFGALELLRPLLDTLAERQGSVVLINTRQLRRPKRGVDSSRRRPPVGSSGTRFKSRPAKTSLIRLAKAPATTMPRPRHEAVLKHCRIFRCALHSTDYLPEQ